jgi:hypothetical protein
MNDIARILKQPKQYMVWAGLLLVFCWATSWAAAGLVGPTGKPGKLLLIFLFVLFIFYFNFVI